MLNYHFDPNEIEGENERSNLGEALMWAAIGFITIYFTLTVLVALF